MKWWIHEIQIHIYPFIPLKAVWVLGVFKSQTLVASTSYFFFFKFCCVAKILTLVLKVISRSCGSDSRKVLAGSR